MLTVDAHQHLVHLDPVGVVLVAACALLALAALPVALIRSQSAFLPGAAWLLRIFVVLGAGFVTALASVGGGAGGWTAWEAFDAARRLDLGAVWIGLAGLGVAAVELWTRHESRRRQALVDDVAAPAVGGPPVDLAALALVGLVALVAGSVHAAWLRTVGPLPGLSARGCETVHVGLSCSPELTVTKLGVTRRKGLFNAARVPVLFDTEAASRGTAFPDLGGWEIPAVTVRDDRPGELYRTVVASQPGIRVEAIVGPFRVAEEVGDPALPLAPGQRWTYRRSTRDSNRFLFFFGTDTVAVDEAPVQVEVGTAEEVHGLRVLPVTTTWAEEWETVRVARVDGEVLLVGEDGRLEPALAWGQDDADFALPDGAPASRPCSVAWLSGYACRCAGPLDAARSLGGPAHCSRTRSGGALGTVLLAVITAGMVIDGPRVHELALVESRQGPPRPAPDPMPDPMPEPEPAPPAGP